MLIPVSNAAVPDPRYATGVGNGALAELIGLGPSGVRWGQVAVIAVGTWLAGNPALLQTLAVPSGTIRRTPCWASPSHCCSSSRRSPQSVWFQGGLSIVVSSALFYSVLITALRVATSLAFGGLSIDYWLRSGAAAFSWMALTMCALQFAVAGSGSGRWFRMAGAFFVASLVQSAIVASMYLDILDADQLFSYLAAASATQIVTPILWTFAFWLGLTKVAR